MALYLFYFDVKMELHNLTRDSTDSYLRAANKNGGWVMITIILRVVRMKKIVPVFK